MSKDTPEVGDIWIHDRAKNIRHLIVDAGVLLVHTVSLGYKKHLIGNPYDADTFTREFTYLGKSKANIDDLFKTENDE